MFSFENLEVYKKAKQLNFSILKLLTDVNPDKHISDQLKRASFSVVLNIAEGSGRFTNRDKRHFLIIARSSLFECVAILEYLLESKNIDSKQYILFYNQIEQISKMLFAMIRKLE